ncbi:hypothetical protein [Actinomadura rugatobispora]|uniref:Acyltransferase n=1 Tax=Actinomadura rugatobispora TaxID=1994 RepID=A0ABW1A317_9ACTN|nr:hypothetical protein GCM10010200_018330 [Actinomadura rugatobispora]
MSGPCDEAFRVMADRLGGISCDADPVGTLRDPAGLTGWTLPVVEALMIAGAVLALLHAVRTWRRTGDPAGPALWSAAVAFVLILEPPLYFPRQFGISEYLDVLFVHNVFSVQFLFDRMPLYIVALYPACFYLACALVTRLGVFRRHGRVVGAVCVGFVNHCFYEIFDHLGPQLRWWAWNTGAAVNDPALGSVPLVSTVIFGFLAPALLVFWWRTLFPEPAPEPAGRGPLGAPGVAVRVLLVGVLTTVSLPVFSAPVSYLTLTDTPNRAVMAAVLYTAIAVAAVVAVAAVARSAPADAPATGDRFLDRYALLHGTVYLAVFALLWAAATPDLLAAEGGRTGDGAPVGNPFYALACAAVCVWVLWRAARLAPAARTPETGHPARTSPQTA